jgi:hypothetical protein
MFLRLDVGGLGADCISQRLQAADAIVADVAQLVHFCTVGLQKARLVRIGEERNRFVGLDQNDVAEILQRVECEFDDIRHAIERVAPLPARNARVGALRHHLATGLACDLLGERQPVLAQRAMRHQDQRRFAALQDLRCGIDGG